MQWTVGQVVGGKKLRDVWAGGVGRLHSCHAELAPIRINDIDAFLPDIALSGAKMQALSLGIAVSLTTAQESHDYDGFVS